MSFAEIRNINNSPALVIDGKVFPPMAMTTRFHKPEYIRKLGEAGLKVFFLMTNTDWLRPGRDDTDAAGNAHHEDSGLEAFEKNARMLLKEVPDAYIIVRIGLHPPVCWMEENPDELITYQDGSHGTVIYTAKDIEFRRYSPSGSVHIPWSRAAARLKELVSSQDYFTPEEKDRWAVIVQEFQQRGEPLPPPVPRVAYPPPTARSS